MKKNLDWDDYLLDAITKSSVQHIPVGLDELTISKTPTTSDTIEITSHCAVGIDTLIISQQVEYD